LPEKIKEKKVKGARVLNRIELNKSGKRKSRGVSKTKSRRAEKQKDLFLSPGPVRDIDEKAWERGKKGWETKRGGEDGMRRAIF